MSSEWSNLYVLRPFSDPQHEEDILRGFGVRKTCQHMTGRYMHFECDQDTFCGYKMRWEKPSGMLQAMGQHSHDTNVSRRKRKSPCVTAVGDETENKFSSSPSVLTSGGSREELRRLEALGEQARTRAATFGVYPSTRATSSGLFWSFGSRNGLLQAQQTMPPALVIDSGNRNESPIETD